jgi:hypothetical protein
MKALFLAVRDSGRQAATLVVSSIREGASRRYGVNEKAHQLLPVLPGRPMLMSSAPAPAASSRAAIVSIGPASAP